MTKHITKEMLSVANMPDTPTARKILAKMLDDDDTQDYVRPWVGLTDKELQPIADEYRILFGSWVKDFAVAIEAKLKEKNA